MNIALSPTLRSGLFTLAVSLAVSLSIGTAAFAAVSRHAADLPGSAGRNDALAGGGAVPAPLAQVTFTPMTDQLIVAEVMTGTRPRAASRATPHPRAQQPANPLPQLTARLNGQPFTVIM